MKKTRLHAAIMALTLPLAAFSLGMGDMAVESSLNQPFKAEIPLIDVDMPLAGIKANLASIEDFERIGLDRNEILTLLKFEVKKNNHGKPVIAISSSERIVEPYLEIVIDLAWANGQLYRAYTVLLDPPGYQLSSNKTAGSAVKTTGAYSNQPGVIDKDIYAHVVDQNTGSGKVRKEATYGPTVANENIWQIAQRYTTPDTTVQQVILAIVGTNSQAFTQGNLNGLKSGERLRIPSSDEVKKIPADLARKEVSAHDEAWQNKEEIKHVLLPPYIDGVTGSSQFAVKPKPQTQNAAKTSEIPEAPVIDHESSNSDTSFSSILSAADNFITAAPQTQAQPQKPADTNANQAANSAIKAEIDVNTAAVDSVRLVNTQLKAQVKTLEDNNQALQQKMEQRDKDINQLRQQMELILKQRNGVAAQTSALPATEESSNWLTYLLLLLAGTGLGAGSLFFWRQRMQRDEGVDYEEEVLEEKTLAPHVEKPAPVLESAATSAETASVMPAALVEAPAAPVQQEKTSAEKVSAQEPPDNTLAMATDELSKEALLSAEPEVSEEDQEYIIAPDVEDELQDNDDDEEMLLFKNNDIEIPTTDLQDDKRPAYKRPLSDLAGPGSEPESSLMPAQSPADDVPAAKHETASEDEYMLDFEPSLEKIVEKNKKEQNAHQPQTHDHEEGLDFVVHEEAKADKNTAPAQKTKADDGQEESEEEEETDESVIEFESAKEIEEMLNETESEQTNYANGVTAIPEEEIIIDSEAAKEIEDILKESDEDLPKEEEVAAVETIKLDEEAEENEFFLNEESAETEETPEEELVEEETSAQEDEESAAHDGKPEKLVKSRAALDTLLALAKTYISMDDIDAARQSLQEVVEYGNKRQQKDAQKLLKEIENK